MNLLFIVRYSVDGERAILLQAMEKYIISCVLLIAVVSALFAASSDATVAGILYFKSYN